MSAPYVFYKGETVDKFVYETPELRTKVASTLAGLVTISQRYAKSPVYKTTFVLGGVTYAVWYYPVLPPA